MSQIDEVLSKLKSNTKKHVNNFMQTLEKVKTTSYTRTDLELISFFIIYLVHHRVR